MKRTKINTALFSLLLSLFLMACSKTNLKESIASRPNILFLIADDWSYPHAGAYGDQIVRTPTFDFLANNGALFNHAYCAAPSCAPSRAAILTGRYPHQLESGANLWPILYNKFPNYVQALEKAGYLTGKSRKGWAPGDFKKGGFQQNPAGKDYQDFDNLLANRKEGQPFCYWFGSNDPHRVYETNTGVKTGMPAKEVIVPAFLPDLPCVRNDLLDYYFEVERFDRECGQIISKLKALGELDNTLILMTSDNGMPFPRAKATVYDYGSRMPLAAYWKGKKIGTIDDFVNFIDFAPTILEAAGLSVPDAITGNSFLPLLEGEKDQINREQVYLERERHANVRLGDLSYPVRAIRNHKYLYIRNFEPDRWPAGDPKAHQSVGQYGDVDNSITKYLMLTMEGKSQAPDYFKLAFGKRPVEELYDVQKDPYQLNNLAIHAEQENTLAAFRQQLQKWMVETNDLRDTEPNTIYWDTVTYTPNYDFDDFDVLKRIEEYTMLDRKGTNRFDSLKCSY